MKTTYAHTATTLEKLAVYDRGEARRATLRPPRSNADGNSAFVIVHSSRSRCFQSPKQPRRRLLPALRIDGEAVILLEPLDGGCGVLAAFAIRSTLPYRISFGDKHLLDEAHGLAIRAELHYAASPRRLALLAEDAVGRGTYDALHLLDDFPLVRRGLACCHVLRAREAAQVPPVYLHDAALDRLRVVPLDHGEGARSHVLHYAHVVGPSPVVALAAVSPVVEADVAHLRGDALVLVPDALLLAERDHPLAVVLFWGC